MTATTSSTQPDNRPVSVFPDRGAFIVAAFKELNRRLAPAQLADHGVNGSLLFANQNVAGSNPQTVGELVDQLEAAVKEILWDRKLVWKIEPKALVGPNTPVKQVSAAESEEQFGKWQKDAEKKDKDAKERAATEKRIVSLINNFAPARNNRIDYGTQEKAQTNYRGWLTDAKAKGGDLRQIEKQIRDDQAKIHDQVERSSWKM